jgi:hypothetical protein
MKNKKSAARSLSVAAGSAWLHWGYSKELGKYYAIIQERDRAHALIISDDSINWRRASPRETWQPCRIDAGKILPILPLSRAM